MKIGIPKEVQVGETRVALIPSLVPLLLKNQHEVLVKLEQGFRHFSPMNSIFGEEHRWSRAP